MVKTGAVESRHRGSIMDLLLITHATRTLAIYRVDPRHVLHSLGNCRDNGYNVQPLDDHFRM